MNTTTMVVLFLLGLAFVLVPGGLAYLAYRHPGARGPMAIAIAAVAAMGAVLGPIMTR